MNIHKTRTGTRPLPVLLEGLLGVLLLCGGCKDLFHEKSEEAGDGAVSIYTAHTAEAFLAAVNKINNATEDGIYDIKLAESFSTSSIEFIGNAKKTIVLRGDENNHSIINNGNDDLFRVHDGITLILGNNITLNGNYKEHRAVVVNGGGTLFMQDGAVIIRAWDSGVNVYGSFNMQGGIIADNYGYWGGGVGVWAGSFIMSGGTIKGNSANHGGGGVYVSGFNGSFTMSDGFISGNTAGSYGGGVSVAQGNFIKTGGTIYGVEAGGLLKNTVTSGNSNSHAVEASGKIRKTTAGTDVILDSSLSGIAGGWE